MVASSRAADSRKLMRREPRMPVDGIVTNGSAAPDRPKADSVPDRLDVGFGIFHCKVQDVPDDEVLNDISFVAAKPPAATSFDRAVSD